MELFTTDNTAGYTEAELQALSAEADIRVPELVSAGLDEDEARKAFSEEVARR